MSPSQRATRGAEAFSPPLRPVRSPPACSRSESYSAASAASTPASPPVSRCPVPSPSGAPPRASRHRRARSAAPRAAPPAAAGHGRLRRAAPPPSAHELGRGRRRSLTLRVAVAPGGRAGQAHRPLPDLAPLRSRILAEGTAQQRQRLDERSGGMPVNQPSTRRSSRSSCTSRRPSPVRNPSIQAAARATGTPDGEHQRHPPTGLGRRPAARRRAAAG